MDNNKNKQYLFDNPKNTQRVLYILYACCTLLVLLDFVIHRHVYHSWENLPAFYPIYGFVGCVVLVIVARWMRTFLMRSEDYYDRGYDKADDSPDDNDSDSHDGSPDDNISDNHSNNSVDKSTDENTHKGANNQTKNNKIGDHDVDA
jgi:hypothetical protein